MRREDKMSEEIPGTLDSWAKESGLDKPTDRQKYGYARGRSITELMFTKGDDRGQAVVLAWRLGGWFVAAIGPFPSKAAAHRYGRTHHFRRHIVIGLHSPGGA